jgi:23S rRNA (cytidine1920-2'-O)/16S rRNA (cytidine1409-2'-O)-methyltransferase
MKADKSGIFFEEESNKLIEDAVLRAAAELK